MSPEVKSRALEPFYTTKSRGLGTGLGLSLVHGVVQNAGGSVAIESEPGEGTTIVLTFPAVAPWPADEPADDDGAPLALVSVEDRRTASLVVNVLEMAGIDVTSEEDEPPGPVSLLITEAQRVGRLRKRLANDCVVIALGPVPAGWSEPDVLVIENANDFDSLRTAVSQAFASGFES
jgi:hypothetical protein